MQEIAVNASKNYSVKIGSGLLNQLGAEAASVVSGRKAVIVSDSNVGRTIATRLFPAWSAPVFRSLPL